MAVLGINYDGGGYVYDENDERTGEIVPIEYQSVYLSTQNEKFEFSSGNFIVDWYNAIKKFHMDVDEPYLSHSSSVNHFIMDGAPYSSAYGHWDGGDKLVLKYLDKNWGDTVDGMVKARKIYEGGVELFVEDGTTPTFEELKEYVNNFLKVNS